jgi:hypothetical protein
MAKRIVTVFYAWQSDRNQRENRHLIRQALNTAAQKINSDSSLGIEIKIDADTEGVVGTPAVTETILNKIRASDIFVPDLTFVAKTVSGKLIPNPNVMAEYGYALRSLTYEAMMPVMNTHYGAPTELPFDLGHVRHPTQYHLSPSSPDGVRRTVRSALTDKLEGILRLMAQHIVSKARTDIPFSPQRAVRPPAFFFQPDDVLANFGNPGEQELRFKRDRAVFIRLYPTYADQPRIGLTKAIEVARRLSPMQRVNGQNLTSRNHWGAISLQPSGNGITSFTQIFDTGEIWGASEEAFLTAKQAAVVAIRVEKAFVTAMDDYRNGYQTELKLRPPFTVEFGAVGLRNEKLVVHSAEFTSGDYAGPILQRNFSRKFQINSFDRDEWTSVLREFLNDFYDLAARDRSKVLTDDIIRQNGLPPI